MELCARSRRPNLLSLQLCCAAYLLCAVWLSGMVQTAIYCDFFYYYIKAWKNNEKLALPA